VIDDTEIFCTVSMLFFKLLKFGFVMMWYVVVECAVRLCVLRQKCAACGKSGATVGCAYRRCAKNFHYCCAIESMSLSDKSKCVIVEWRKHQDTISYLYVVIVSVGSLASVVNSSIVFLQAVTALRVYVTRLSK